MRIRYDQTEDALYLRLDESAIVESEEVRPGVVIDFNDLEQIVGIELRRVSEQSPGANLKQIDVQVA
jgi:uncharacterized protein YuzE